LLLLWNNFLGKFYQQSIYVDGDIDTRIYKKINVEKNKEGLGVSAFGSNN